MTIANKQVVKAWANGQGASARNLWTNGRELYSYLQLIGRTGVRNGAKVVIDHTAPADGYISQTTSCHVNLAKSEADAIECPNTGVQEIIPW